MAFVGVGILPLLKSSSLPSGMQKHTCDVREAFANYTPDSVTETLSRPLSFQDDENFNVQSLMNAVRDVAMVAASGLFVQYELRL